MYKLLSHNDLDGVGCGILAKLAYGNQIDVRYNSISKLNYEVSHFLEEENKETYLYITDLSVNEENEKKLNEHYKNGGKVQLIDHHKTALHFNEYDWAFVEVQDKEGVLTSATSMFYAYLLEHGKLEEMRALNEFVELVRQYDTWDWEKNENIKAKQLNALFFLLSINEFEETMIHRLETSDRFYFEPFEQKLLDMEETKIDRFVRKKRRQIVQAEIDNYFSGVVYAESYLSELGNELGKEYPHLDYIAMLNIGSKRISFRTIHDDIDVSEVAQKYGGGGHSKASGCTMTTEAFQQFVVNTFELDSLKEDARYNEHNVRESSFGTMYRDREQHVYFIYPMNESQWGMTKDKMKTNESFESYEEAERFLKRKTQSWLVTDRAFVTYLKGMINSKN